MRILYKAFHSLYVNSNNIVQKIGFDPMDRVNETGHLCLAIQWNCVHGFAGAIDLLNRYLNPESDSYYIRRIFTRDSKQKLQIRKICWSKKSQGDWNKAFEHYFTVYSLSTAQKYGLAEKAIRIFKTKKTNLE